MTNIIFTLERTAKQIKVLSPNVESFEIALAQIKIEYPDFILCHWKLIEFDAIINYKKTEK